MLDHEQDQAHVASIKFNFLGPCTEPPALQDGSTRPAQAPSSNGFQPISGLDHLPLKSGGPTPKEVQLALPHDFSSIFKFSNRCS